MANSENTTENMNSQTKSEMLKIIKKLKVYYDIQGLVMSFRADVKKYLDPLANQYPYDVAQYYFAADFDLFMSEIIKRTHEETSGLIEELGELENKWLTTNPGEHNIFFTNDINQ